MPGQSVNEEQCWLPFGVSPFFTFIPQHLFPLKTSHCEEGVGHGDGSCVGQDQPRLHTESLSITNKCLLALTSKCHLTYQDTCWVLTKVQLINGPLLFQGPALVFSQSRCTRSSEVPQA